MLVRTFTPISQLEIINKHMSSLRGKFERV